MAMTMLQMAGAAPTPATMADGVLLIIDAQREYTDGLMPLPGVQPAIDALAVLLEKARKVGAPVVFADGFAGPPKLDSKGRPIIRYRPVGLAVGPDGALYVADSNQGRVWRIAYGQ